MPYSSPEEPETWGNETGRTMTYRHCSDAGRVAEKS